VTSVVVLEVDELELDSQLDVVGVSMHDWDDVAHEEVVGVTAQLPVAV
jgi:hypothetical protein